MNPLIYLQLFIRDLLVYPEELIERGRRNFEQVDFETDYIVVDGLGGSPITARSERFDPVAEEMEYTRRTSKTCTVDFYGDNAFTNSNKFVTLIGSQLSFDLQHELGVTIGGVSSITDVKALTGQQYGQRLQLSLVMQYNISSVVPTLRIDESQLEFITN